MRIIYENFKYGTTQKVIRQEVQRELKMKKKIFLQKYKWTVRRFFETYFRYGDIDFFHHSFRQCIPWKLLVG